MDDSYLEEQMLEQWQLSEYQEQQLLEEAERQAAWEEEEQKEIGKYTE